MPVINGECSKCGKKLHPMATFKEDSSSRYTMKYRCLNGNCTASPQGYQPMDDPAEYIRWTQLMAK